MAVSLRLASRGLTRVVVVVMLLLPDSGSLDEALTEKEATRKRGAWQSLLRGESLSLSVKLTTSLTSLPYCYQLVGNSVSRAVRHCL